MHSHHMYIVAAVMILCFFSCSSTRELPTEKNVDLNRYAGVWYEIARLPNRFERNLKCVTAQYKLLGPNKIEVVNKGYSITKNKYKSVKGKAWVPDNAMQGRIKVQFYWPFTGDYYIILLDENYTYALVGDPSRKFLWFLSKNPQLDDAIYAIMSDKAKSLGFNIGEIIKVEHNCGNSEDPKNP